MSVAGCRLIHEAIAREPGLVAGDVSDFDPVHSITFRGWSPSLHRTRMRASVTLHRATPEAVARELDPILAIQRRRRTAAILLGLPADGETSVWRIDHMALDAVLMAHDPGVVDRLRQWPHDIAGVGMPALDEFAGDGVTTVNDGTPRDPRPRVYVLSKTPFGHFDGSDLMIEAELPETTLAACIGRRVADVVDVTGHSPALDRLAGRDIVDARMNGDRVVLTTWPEWTSVPADAPIVDALATPRT